MLKTDKKVQTHTLPLRTKNGSTRRQILQIVREERAVSRAEIARRLQLSRPTASRIVDTL